MEKPRSITVKISQEVIDEANSRDSSKCMIAQALRMAGASSTNVTAESASFNMDGMRYTYPMPAKAAVELIRFDTDKSLVKPFTFILDGRLGFSRPVIKRPNNHRGKTKHATKSNPQLAAARRTIRRHHGLRMIEVSSK